MADVVLVEVADRIATVTLNRPEARNALNAELRVALQEVLGALEVDDGVDVVVLTGADPAFCAGLDLKELGAGDHDLGGHHRTRAEDDPVLNRPFPTMTKPVIGAINGAAITGGFEIALNCSFLVASERARFADTHARVGVMPGWGLTVLLPQAIGVRRAREMSLTGNFLDADGALAAGLVNHVVPHEALLPTALALAADIVGNDQPGVRRMLATYAEQAATVTDEASYIEARVAKEWQSHHFDPADIERRRAAVVERGRSQSG